MFIWLFVCLIYAILTLVLVAFNIAIVDLVPAVLLSVKREIYLHMFICIHSQIQKQFGNSYGVSWMLNTVLFSCFFLLLEEPNLIAVCFYLYCYLFIFFVVFFYHFWLYFLFILNNLWVAWRSFEEFGRVLRTQENAVAD